MLTGLDHITIASQDLARTERFYCSLLGLRIGDRPAFRVAGLWLYLGDTPLVHVVQRGAPSVGAGVIDHVAFGARGLHDWIARLDAADTLYELKRQPGTETWQLFLHDPDGARVEIAFDRSERP